jgi:hypothetical protein
VAVRLTRRGRGLDEDLHIDVHKRLECSRGVAGVHTSTSLTPFFLDFAFKAKGKSGRERGKKENG